MAIVHFSQGIAHHTGGQTRIEIEAGRVIDLLRVLCERFPALRGEIDDWAVAIDDEIHNDARYQPLRADSEIHFLPRIAGG